MSWKHISGWVQVTEPEGGNPIGPVDPGWGTTPPTDPGYGRPGWGGGNYPTTGPIFGGGGGGGNYPTTGPILGGGNYPTTGPIYGGGHPGNKPPGRPILPPHPDNKPPSAPAHPWIPGHWEILDPGFGKPPLLGLIPTDPGFGISETPPPVPSNELPPGQWVPTDPDYGIPQGPCGGLGGKPHPPLWAWIPTPPDLSKPA